MTTDTGDTNSCNPCTKLELPTIFIAELRGSAINGERKDGRKNRQLKGSAYTQCPSIYGTKSQKY